MAQSSSQSKGKRDLVIDEFFDTETSYVNQLGLFLEVMEEYKKTLQDRHDTYSKVSEVERHIESLKAIYKENNAILQSLQNKDWNDVKSFFQQVDFGALNKAIVTLGNMRQYFDTLGKPTQDVIERKIQRKKSLLSIDSFLVMPFQRAVRYKMLLEVMAKDEKPTSEVTSLYNKIKEKADFSNKLNGDYSDLAKNTHAERLRLTAVTKALETYGKSLPKDSISMQTTLAQLASLSQKNKNGFISEAEFKKELKIIIAQVQKQKLPEHLKPLQVDVLATLKKEMAALDRQMKMSYKNKKMGLPTTAAALESQGEDAKFLALNIGNERTNSIILHPAIKALSQVQSKKAQQLIGQIQDKIGKKDSLDFTETQQLLLAAKKLLNKKSPEYALIEKQLNTAVALHAIVNAKPFKDFIELNIKNPSMSVLNGIVKKEPAKAAQVANKSESKRPTSDRMRRSIGLFDQILKRNPPDNKGNLNRITDRPKQSKR